MGCEAHKLIVQNIDKDSLLEAMLLRDDLPEIIQLFRYHEDMAPREYMDIKEVQEYLRCSRSYALELAKFGYISKEFQVNKLGKKWLIDRLSYERWISRGGHK